MDRYSRRRSDEVTLEQLRLAVIKLQTEVSRLWKAQRAEQDTPAQGQGTEIPEEPSGGGGGGGEIYAGRLTGTLIRGGTVNVNRHKPSTGVIGSVVGVDSVTDVLQIIPLGITLQSANRVCYFKASNTEDNTYILLSFDPIEVTT